MLLKSAINVSYRGNLIQFISVRIPFTSRRNAKSTLTRSDTITNSPYVYKPNHTNKFVQIYELFHIYSHHFTPHGKIWTQQIGLAPNVWLHSSVGRASHRYRGGHGFESRWSPDFFQASSFQLLKLENSLRGSFFTFIYDRSSNIWIISYILTSLNTWPQISKC